MDREYRCLEVVKCFSFDYSCVLFGAQIVLRKNNKGKDRYTHHSATASYLFGVGLLTQLLFRGQCRELFFFFFPFHNLTRLGSPSRHSCTHGKKIERREKKTGLGLDVVVPAAVVVLGAVLPWFLVRHHRS